MSLRPLPTETRDGTYVPEAPITTGIAKDLLYIDFNDVKTMVEVSEVAATGEPVNDKHYIMERVIQVNCVELIALMFSLQNLTSMYPVC